MKQHPRNTPVTSIARTVQVGSLARFRSRSTRANLLAPAYSPDHPSAVTHADLRQLAESSASGASPLPGKAYAPDDFKENRPLRTRLETWPELGFRRQKVKTRDPHAGDDDVVRFKSPRRSDLVFRLRSGVDLHEPSRVRPGADDSDYPHTPDPIACPLLDRLHVSAAAKVWSAHNRSVHVSNSDGTLGVEEAARVCGVSDETIRRRLRAGRFVGARREAGPASAWRIPVADLLADGFRPHFASGGSGMQLPPEELESLRRDLAVALAVADERLTRIAHLEAQLTAVTAVLHTMGASR